MASTDISPSLSPIKPTDTAYEALVEQIATAMWNHWNPHKDFSECDQEIRD
jgi:hypothetical protein